jgi:hypothetical protein
LLGKKKQTFCVGRVISVNCDADEVKSKFMRRIPSKKDYIFIFPDKEEMWENDIDDVVMKLPSPICVGGTARSKKQFRFSDELLCKFGSELE